MILPHPTSLREFVVVFCPRFLPRSRYANSVLVSSLQIVVSHVVYCKIIVQRVLLFMNFWPSNYARLHRRWRVSSEQLHVIRLHSRYNVIREKSRNLQASFIDASISRNVRSLKLRCWCRECRDSVRSEFMDVSGNCE